MSNLLLLTALVAAPAQYLPGGDWRTNQSWEPNPACHDQAGTAMVGGVDANLDGWPDLLTTDYDGASYYQRVGRVRLWSGYDGSLLWTLGLEPAELFGEAACILGDVDGDGVQDFAVSDWERNNGYSGEGAVWVISGRTGELIHEILGGYFDEGFGSALSSAGDLDRDGTDDLLVGVREARSARTYAGELRVFSGASGQLLMAFKSPTPTSSDDLGTAVLGPGDLDGDGVPDVVGGSAGTRPDSSVYATGAVFAFSGRSGALLWRHDGVEVGESCGSALARLPDLDFDGVPELAVGADFRNAYGAGSAGKVVFLSGRTGTPLGGAVGAHANDRFGSSLLTIPDQDRDGLEDLAVAVEYLYQPPGIGGFAFVSSASGAVLDLFAATPSPYRTAAHFAFLPAWGSERLPAVATTAVERVSFSPRNLVSVLQRDPLLRSDSRSISVSAGGGVSMSIQFPVYEAGMEYLVAGSISGVGVSPLFGLAVPLRVDAFTIHMLSGRVPGFSAAHGRLDSAATGTATWTVGPGAPSVLIGRTAAFCAITHDNYLGRVTSLPVVISFVP